RAEPGGPRRGDGGSAAGGGRGVAGIHFIFTSAGRDAAGGATMTRRLASPPAFAWLTLIAAIAGGVVLIAAAGATWYLFQRDAHRHARAESDDGQWYISGMHPWIIQPE